jgi:tRNA pseudouridine38-40 synthase
VEQGYLFEISADRFLRNMVRSITGTLLDVGRGKLDLEGFKKIVEAKDRSKAGSSAPAKGLFLTDIGYPEPVDSN